MSSLGDPEGKVALLAGGSGLVGGYVLAGLLDAPDFSRIYAISRRQLNREHFRLANRIVQFERLEEQLKGMSCHVALCCLGTTLRAAGSQQAFRKVDLEYVLSFARAAKAAQAQRFVVVSSVGANAASKNFYLRVKGEMEDELARIGFPALDILQPSLMLGFRREMRPLELLAMVGMPLANPFLLGSKEPYRAIPARTVAAAVIGAARSGRRGVNRFSYAGIKTLAASKPAPRPAPLTPAEKKARANQGRGR
jgi:uncharacterized protein YbjT (DUF2867 family)